jgi:L-ribulokinase
MAVVAGVDFGTLSVRVSIFDSQKGRLGFSTAEYPLLRKREDPDHATQKHADHMAALVQAAREAVAQAGVRGDDVAAMALDTTGSSVVPVGEGLAPLDDYYLWCDHRASREAAEITAAARTENLEAIQWCGGVYSSEWGFAKLLHWLRQSESNPQRLVTALEHCDMVAATLCGITDLDQLPRSICAMGHKWMWNESLGGLPPESFLAKLDARLAGVAHRLRGRYATSDQLAGRLSAEWAQKLGLKAGIPIPVGAFDAHWDAVGAGIREGDVVNVIGTSTCIMAIARQTGLIPGLCGIVKGSIHPGYFGVEAGLSATGDIFDAIARRAQTNVAQLSKKIADYRGGQSGLLRLTWDNGDRTVLVNAELGGVTLGWNLTHTPEDELFAAIEGTAFHTRIILDRMAGHGVPVRRVINGGGVPQRNETLNRVYANVLNKPVLIPAGDVTSLGSAIFASLAAGAFPTIERAQQALCPGYRTIDPQPDEALRYEELFPLFRDLYFGFGSPQGEARRIGDVLPKLRAIAAAVRPAS